MHSIVYDPVHDEFTVPQQFGQAILTFRGSASGQEPPIRIIQGPKTLLTAPDRLEVDYVHNEIFVPMGDVVLVYRRDAQGDVAPIRTIQGPDTQLDGVDAAAVDPIHNVLVLDGQQSRGHAMLMIFDRTAAGNAKPKALIGGPHSKLSTIGGPYVVYPPRSEILVSLRSSFDSRQLASPESFVGVWSINDNGDVPPKYTIGGPNGVLQMPRGIALDPRHKTLMVSDKRLNAVLTFSFPEIF
jgi:hypothetical protein